MEYPKIFLGAKKKVKKYFSKKENKEVTQEVISFSFDHCGKTLLVEMNFNKTKDKSGNEVYYTNIIEFPQKKKGGFE